MNENKDKKDLEYRDSDNNRSRGKNGRNRSGKHGNKQSRSNGYRGKDSQAGGKAYNYDSGKLSPLNDFSWWNHNPLLTEGAARFPYTTKAGMRFNFFHPGEQGQTVADFTVPGIAVLEWLPTVGQSSQPEDPASIIGTQLYSKVRAAYSGALAVDAPDFVIYLLGLDSVFSYIARLRRIYRVVNVFSPENHNTPDVLLAALGIDDTRAISSIRREKVKLWQGINTLIAQTHRVHCPAVFDLFNRHVWMNENVYTDAPVPNSQWYVFRQDSYYKFAAINTPDGVPAGGLKPSAPPMNADATVDALLDFGSELINAFLGWDDVFTISGYLGRAFEGTPEYVIPELAQDEVFSPVYVPEVLMQIENANTICDGNSNAELLASTQISQNPLTNCILSAPKLPSYKSTTWQHNWSEVLTMRTDTPGVQENVIASRLHASVDAHDGRVLCCTEIPVVWRIYINEMVSPTSKPYYRTMGVMQRMVLPYNLEAVGFREAFEAVGSITNFDWHPLVFCAEQVSETKYKPFIFGDLHNPTKITPEMLENLHRVCLYSAMNAFGF